MKAVRESLRPVQLGAFYFFHFAALGAFLPYWAVYLYDRGYSAQTIGILTALLLGTKIVAPYCWGWIADHGQSRVAIIRTGAFLSAVSFAGIFWAEEIWQLTLVIVAFGFFWNAVLPQFEVVTMAHLKGQTHYYSRIRLWGSVGFIASSLLLAVGVSEAGIVLFPTFVFLILVLLWLNTLILSEEEQCPVGEHSHGFWKYCANGSIISLLLICFLNQVAHGPYYAFFSLYLEEHGYPIAGMGLIWSIAVVAEIVIFMLVHRWLPVAGAPSLLLLAVAIGSIRWLLLAFTVSYWPLLLFSQLLHAATFGLAHAAAIHLIDQLFRGEFRGRGQALYSSVSFGLGGAVGSLLSGLMWEEQGGRSLYTIAAVVAALGAVQFLAAGWSAFRYNKQLFK